MKDSALRWYMGRRVKWLADDYRIVNADTIIVLNGGKIVEGGTHDELLKKGGSIISSRHSRQPGDEG
jgi:ABC-type multidrug transport system ATPase subunit